MVTPAGPLAPGDSVGVWWAYPQSRKPRRYRASVRAVLAASSASTLVVLQFLRPPLLYEARLWHRRRVGAGSTHASAVSLDLFDPSRVFWDIQKGQAKPEPPARRPAPVPKPAPVPRPGRFVDQIPWSPRLRAVRRRAALQGIRGIQGIRRIRGGDGFTYVARSDVHGRGLFAARRFRAGDVVAEYTGGRFVKAPLRRNLTGSAARRAAPWLFSVYCHRSNRLLGAIDASDPAASGMARFANAPPRGAPPNCEFRQCLTPDSRIPAVFLVAVRACAPHCELLASYGRRSRAVIKGKGASPL